MDFKESKKYRIFLRFWAVCLLGLWGCKFNSRNANQLPGVKAKIISAANQNRAISQARPTGNESSVCFDANSFSSSWIQDQIRQLEFKWSRREPTGTRNRANRSAARYFLNRLRHQGFRDHLFDGCETAECGVDRVYRLAQFSAIQTPGIAEKIYYLFLKTGVIFGLSNRIEGEDVIPPTRHAPLREFLWSESEVFAAVRFVQFLPSSYTHLPTLNNIYIVPNGYRISTWNTGTCADATTSRDSGYIRIGRECLEDYLSPNPTRGKTFELSLFHEWTHARERLGENFSNTALDDSQFISQSQVWFDLSDFEMRGGIPVRKNTSGAEPYVHPYAGQNPAEDLAETSAFLRFKPRSTLALVPQKSDFVRRRLFENISAADLLNSVPGDCEQTR